jgi:hypothetical protein
VWSFVVVVFDEFPVELESGMFEVVGSEPSFYLAKRCRLADAAEDMLDPLLLTCAVKLDSSLRTLQNCDPWSVRISLGLEYSWMALSSGQMRFSVVPSLKCSEPVTNLERSSRLVISHLAGRTTLRSHCHSLLLCLRCHLA